MRRHLPLWTYLSIPIGFIAWVIVMEEVVHPSVARLLFSTWSVSTVQIYTLALAAVALAVLAWFDLTRRTLTPGAHARLWVAVMCTVPVTLLVQLPARQFGRQGAERLVRELGYELGTTENTVGATVLFAAIPTVALCGVLLWWASGHSGRVPFAYAALIVWLLVVAFTGWALGHP
ncbi:hypothetical protein [Pengzhenrongella phosphoraccumulans]|uniref:hypothetical protein n=1 Tax=Pengzhenrongella phosphoraccumulans TaxID=3114394 RepID=UPI00388EB258